MKLPKLTLQAEAALVLSLFRASLIDLKKEHLNSCLVWVRIVSQKYTLLVNSPIAKAELSLVSGNLQHALSVRGFTWKLIISISTWNL